MPSQIFDTHPHIISTDTSRYPIAPLGGKRSDWSERRPVDFGQLVDAMNAAGVAKAAIVHSSTTYGYDNSYVADAVASQPNRFTGVFSVDVHGPDAPARIDHWIERGLSGLRLFAVGSTVKTDQSWIASPDVEAAWEHCQNHDIPVAISMRQDGLGHLVAVVKRFPRVRIVLDHLLHVPMDDGPPYSAAAPLFDMASFPNIFLKLTSALIAKMQAPSATPQSFMATLLDRFGSSRIAWGSNYPAVEGALPDLVDHAVTTLAFLPEVDQENIFWRTAASLYPSLVDA